MGRYGFGWLPGEKGIIQSDEAVYNPILKSTTRDKTTPLLSFVLAYSHRKCRGAV